MKSIYVQLIINIEIQGVVDLSLIMERLEDTQLSDANLIDKNQFLKKRNRINTKSK